MKGFAVIPYVFYHYRFGFILVWPALIKHFFDCGWLMAFVIAIIAVIIFVVIHAILAIVGIGLLMLSI